MPRLQKKGTVICSVPKESCAIARIIPTQADATPGWGAFWCKDCNVVTEFAIHRCEVAA